MIENLFKGFGRGRARHFLGSCLSTTGLTPETSMITITDYALPPDVAEHVADEVRDYIRSAAQAWEKVKLLSSELAKERETSEAYRFALSVYGWTRGESQ